MGIGTAPLLEIRGLTKSFPGVKALQGVDLSVARGEVHGLMGENERVEHPYQGSDRCLSARRREIRLDGAEIDPHSPKAAEALGVSTVYQEVNLIPQRSVAENICLGRQPAFWNDPLARGRPSRGGRARQGGFET